MRLITSPPSCAECHEMWEPKRPGTLWATPGLLWDPFTFTLYIYIYKPNIYPEYVFPKFSPDSYFIFANHVNGKGKVHPITDHEGPEGGVEV